MAIDLPREIALKILYDVNEEGAYVNISVNKHLNANVNLRDLDKSFINDLVYGTVKWKLSIDYVLEQYSSVKLRKISKWILNILRLGVYQLLYTTKIPVFSACDESVKLAKKYGHKASSGFVNAVLRSILRDKDNIKYPDRKTDLIRYLAVKYSYPDLLVQEWISNFGADFTESLMVCNNEPPEFTIRVNTVKIDKSGLKKILEKEGFQVSDGKYADESIIIHNPVSVFQTEAFREGYFQVQDESSMFVSKILAPRPGEFVIDVCSAPGGKTTHIAELMKNKGCVLARDIHEHKIKLVDDSARRLGLNIIKSEVFDSTILDESLIDKADRVLVDAPCTGLGIIRRKPDIKWVKSMGDLKEIVALQTRILSNAAKYVRPGGVLVYSTCTVQKEENEDIVKKFIENNKEFKFMDNTNDDLHVRLNERLKNGYIQFYPNVDGIDGFFIARMVRNGGR